MANEQYKAGVNPGDHTIGKAEANGKAETGTVEYVQLSRKNGDAVLKLLKKIENDLSRLEKANHLPDTDKQRIRSYLQKQKKEYETLLFVYASSQASEQERTIIELQELRRVHAELQNDESTLHLITSPISPVVPRQQPRKAKKAAPSEEKRLMNPSERVEFSRENLSWWVENNPKIEFQGLKSLVDTILDDNTPEDRAFEEIKKLQRTVETLDDGAFGRNSRLALEVHIQKLRDTGAQTLQPPSSPTQYSPTVTVTQNTPSITEQGAQNESVTPEAVEIVTPEILGEKLDALGTKIQDKYKYWKNAIQDASGMITAEKAAIAKNRIVSAQSGLIDAIDAYEEYLSVADSNKLPSGEFGKKDLNGLRRQIGEYLRGVGEVENPHFRDMYEAENIFKNILSSDFPGVFPDFPERGELLGKLPKTTRKQLDEALKEKINSRLSYEQAIGQLLSNPKFAGEWGIVRDKALKEYNQEMQASIKMLIAKGVRGEELRALNNLINMYGTRGWWNLTDAQKDQMFAFGNQALAIAAGVAGAVFVATGVGVLGGGPLIALSAAALTGGSITTGAKIAVDQYVPKGSDIAIEAAINTGTFAAGGAIAGATQKALAQGAKNGVSKTGAIATAAGIEATGNVTLGTFLDGIHALKEGSSINAFDSLRNNLTYALLPLFTHGAFSVSRRILARNTYAALEKVKEIEKKSNHGKTVSVAGETRANTPKSATPGKTQSNQAEVAAKAEAKKLLDDVARHVKQEQRILSDAELKAIRAVDGYLPEGAIVGTRARATPRGVQDELAAAAARRKARIIVKTPREIQEEARIARANDMLRFIKEINTPAEKIVKTAQTKKPVQGGTLQGTNESMTQRSVRPENTEKRLFDNLGKPMEGTPITGDRKMSAEAVHNRPSPSQRGARHRPGDVPPLRTPSNIIIDV